MKKKLMILVAMLALMTTTFAAPTMAKVKFDNDGHSDGGGFFVVRDDDRNDFFGDRDRFDNDGGGVSFDLGDTENESGDIETEHSVSIEGNNNNACVGQLQFGNTGNFTNQQGVLQYASEADDIELSGPDISFAPENETACEQSVEQAAAASSW